jgi:integrase
MDRPEGVQPGGPAQRREPPVRLGRCWPQCATSCQAGPCSSPSSPSCTTRVCAQRKQSVSGWRTSSCRTKRPEGDTRIVPVHPELTRLLIDHLALGTAPDGRLFSGVRGGELPTITYRRAWIKARQAALTPAEQASSLARRPYDLRHACLSTWLNGGVYPTQVAEWAGHSVDVLLRIYAKCVVGQDELAKRRIIEALRQD